MASPIEPRADDSLDGWFRRYQQLAVLGVRSAAVAHKIALHLDRFQRFFRDRYGHDRISACLRRDVAAWQQSLITQRLVPATINNHLASLVHSFLALFEQFLGKQGAQRFGVDAQEARLLNQLRKPHTDFEDRAGECWCTARLA